MTATTVRPKPGPQTLVLAALLQQQQALCIENKNRECTMQQANTVMALCFAAVTHFIVRVVNKNQILVFRRHYFILQFPNSCLIS